MVHYNYLRPHTALEDKTPAEVAGIDFPHKNWADITRHKPSKYIVIEHKPRGSIRLEKTNIGRPRKRVRITPSTPRITRRSDIDLGGGVVQNRRTGRRHLRLY